MIDCRLLRGLTHDDNPGGFTLLQLHMGAQIMGDLHTLQLSVLIKGAVSVCIITLSFLFNTPFFPCLFPPVSGGPASDVRPGLFPW